jgi:dipeptidyl-peptidase-4
MVAVSGRIALLLAALAAGVLAQSKKPVTVDAVTRPSAVEPAEVEWSPDGQQFAWVEKDAIRVRNLAGSERELLSRTVLSDAAAAPPAAETFDWTNRRARAKSLQWTPDSKSLLLLVKGDLFLADAGSGKWNQLTKTPVNEEDPKISPDGSRIAFRRQHNLYTMAIDGGGEKRLTRDGSDTRLNGELDWVYPEELELGTAYWWSPDSRSIAYLQFDVSRIMLYPHADLLKLPAVAEPQRYPQAGTANASVRIGVVKATGGSTRWLITGAHPDDLTARVEWMPDSRSLLVQLLNRIQSQLTLAQVDSGGGRPRTVLTEKDAYWINIHDGLNIIEGGKRIVWMNESTGFQHIYLASAASGELAALTRGDWEVSEIHCVDEKAGRIYFTSTAVSPLQRHFYRVSFNGGEPERLTQAAGTHTISMAPSCGAWMDTYSSLAQPPRKTVHTAASPAQGVEFRAPSRAFDDVALVPNEIVRFPASDGDMFYGRLTKPADFQPGKKYPAVVMVYGGPHAQTVRDAWRGADLDQLLAARGFVVWQMDNRGSGGRGHAWESRLYRRFGRQELADQLEGVKHLVSLGFVDEARIGIHGWSYGGYMTLYSLAHAPEVFRAGASGAPVTDYRLYDTIYTERYLGLPSVNEDAYKLSSPLHDAEKIQGKLLLIHNFEDDNVLFQNMLRMTDALQRAGKPFELQIYPQKAHGVTGPARKHMVNAIVDFFERSLK